MKEKPTFVRSASGLPEVKAAGLPQKIKIEGVEVEVMSDEECAKAEVFVAMTKRRAEELERRGVDSLIPGSKNGYLCRVCAADCFLSPSGQKLFAMMPENRVTCIDCAMKMMGGQN